jgi:hypothetical protein
METNKQDIKQTACAKQYDFSKLTELLSKVSSPEELAEDLTELKDAYSRISLSIASECIYGDNPAHYPHINAADHVFVLEKLIQIFQSLK